MYHIAPAGTPIEIKDLGAWLYGLTSSRDTLERFSHEICQRFGVRYCFFMSTGRAALSLLLETIYQIDGCRRNEVIIPSYTCFSVPSSIVKAGLKIRVCDIDPKTLDYDLEQLAKIDFQNTLCIVATNLYGIPNDMESLSDLARKRGVFLVDDAAQCMGGRVGGRYSGSFGDAGIYSLDKGKNITSIDGGIVVTNSDEIAERVRSKINALPSPSVMETFKNVIKFFVYALFLRPSLYWIPNSILNLGGTEYTTQYPVEGYSRVLGGIGMSLFNRMDGITQSRVNNAKFLSEGLKGNSSIYFPAPESPVEPVYLRFPILVRNHSIRDQVISRLRKNGIGATGSYPTSIFDIDQIKPVNGADESCARSGRYVAKRIITLPTHPYVATKHLDAMASVIRESFV